MKNRNLRTAGQNLGGFGPPNFGLSDEKVALLRNPTYEAALRFWDYAKLGKPSSAEAVLAGVHKARIVWPGSTPQMVQESKLWLLRRGLRLP